MENIRDEILESINSNLYTACIFSDMEGILSGSENAQKKAEEIGLTVDFCAPEGSILSEDDLIMQIKGTPDQIAEAEDTLIGLLAKTSGIATAARRFAAVAGSDIRVVCGAWKKMPAHFKKDSRQAAATLFYLLPVAVILLGLRSRVYVYCVLTNKYQLNNLFCREY